MRTDSRVMKKAFAAALMLMMMLMLASCDWGSKGGGTEGSSPSENPESSVSVAVVAGVRSNVNRISVNAKEISDKVYESAYTCGRVVLVRCDGKPEQYLLADIPEPKVKGLSEEKIQQIAEGYRDEILASFDISGAAEYPEADTLEAIRISADALRETENSDEKYLIVVDSGLSTTGYLDFRNGLLEASTEDIIAELKAEKAIPDLSGIEVIWLYCGEVAEPQEQLSELQKEKLKEIYGAVFAEGNAAGCTFRAEAPSAEAYTGLPAVSVVEADERTISVKPLPSTDLDPGKVSFVGDSDKFIDQETAEEEIYKVAEVLLNNPDNRVYVVGGTAGKDDNSDYCRNLSQARAAAVARVMTDYGIEADRIIPVGLGGNTPWHVDDTDANGNMIEKMAQKNRAVWIVDVTDETYGKTISELI